MFGSRRAELLEQCSWQPSGPSCLGFIEVWWPRIAGNEGTDHEPEPNAYHFRSGFLADEEVDDWLHQRHQFSPPQWSSSSPEKPLGETLSCIRLLMCERLSRKFYPPVLAMSRESYLQVERVFGLPVATLPLLCRNAGMEYSNLSFDSTEGKKSTLPTISVIIKYPQMFQLGNLGFAMTHSLSTGNTLAFLYGWSIFRDYNVVTKQDMLPHGERISSLLQSSASLWGHPLLLPTLILQEHLFRADDFMWRSVSRRTQALEFSLGMSRTGRLANTEHAVLEEISKLLGDDGRRLLITSDVNTAMTDAVSFIAVLKWDQRLAAFIQRANSMLKPYYPSSGISPATLMGLDSALEHFTSEAGSLTEYIESIKGRLEIQVSVLYNFVAQAGNNLNSRIASMAGLDSAAMKTLALVTAVFLPPSFVASLFSMSMFDWQASTDDSTGHVVVSNRFWIYWVIAMPLTIGILVGWRYWWKYLKVKFGEEYPNIITEEKEEESQRKKEGDV